MNINITLTWTPRPGQSNHILEVSVHLHSLQMEDRWFTQENKLDWFNPSHLLWWHSKRMEEKNKGRWQRKKAELCLHVREQGFSQNHGIMVITLYPHLHPLFPFLVWFWGLFSLCLILFSIKHFLLEPA